MTIPKEITTIISLINNGMIWIYIAMFFTFSYLFVSLLTWSFIKPLKYLGIPTIIVGGLFLIVRFSASILISIIETNSEFGLIKILLPVVLNPILINGLVCFITGIIMVVLYVIINKKNK